MTTVDNMTAAELKAVIDDMTDDMTDGDYTIEYDNSSYWVKAGDTFSSGMHETELDALRALYKYLAER